MKLQRMMKNAPYEIKTANFRYMNEFWYLDCKFDLMERNIYPNPKEVTESMTAFHAARKHIIHDFPVKDESIVAIAVGDGVTPRTGALFAFRTKWNCISIDPIMREDSEHWNVDRLTVIRSKIEDVPIIKADKVIVLAVHSHASLPATLARIEAEHIAVIAIPCCKQLDIPGQKPDIEYRDWGCWSPENKVRIWRKVLNRT